MVDRHRQLEQPKCRPRWGSLVSEKAFLDMLEKGGEAIVRFQPASYALSPANVNIYARRHSAHSYPITEQTTATADTQPVQLPAVPQRTQRPLTTALAEQHPKKLVRSQQPPAVPPRTRILPPVPPPDTKPRATQAIPASDTKPHAGQAIPASDTKPRATQTTPITDTKPRTTQAIPLSDTKSRTTQTIPPPDTKPRATQAVPPPDTKPRVTQAVHPADTKPCATQAAPPPESATKSKNIQSQASVYHANKIPPAPAGPPPPTPKINNYKPCTQINKSNGVQQYNVNKVSVRQDSSVSSDSFSQTSSPSYTTKTMETPLLPPRTPLKQNGLLIKNHMAEVEANANGTITKSVSTPASLQTIVRFHNGSNMSLHHRIIRDMRRPSSHYVSGVRLRFRFAQIILNAVALLVIGGGMAAYFRAYSTSVQIVNTTVKTNNTPEKEYIGVNPAPGICLPVIVNFCLHHKVPYNYTVFPNYMGHFGQRDAQQELEVYDALVDVRCYELAALFLCSVFVPKCGPGGVVVRPCLSLCMETKRRCGFFLDVFGLALPDYLDCSLFPESPDPEICVGHHEVREARIRSQKPVCPSGFQCDVKRCIPKDWQCDGHVDCKDQSDELNCEKCGPGMIHCGEDKCMTQEHMCDGTVDCPWAQDERNCLRLSERNGDEGRGQLEVFRPEQQKWVPACVEYWNQSTSPAAICSLLGYSRARGSRVLGSMEPSHNDLDLLDMPPSNTWRRKYRRSKNMLKDFGSCDEKIYPTVDLTCSDYKCGKIRKTYAESRSLRIVGGVPSKPGDWPFLAALLGGPEEVFYCAGVLIADQWVLTASHCVGNHSDVSGWTIQLGITRRHAHSYYGQKMKVRRVVPHPAYNVGVAHDNDVALFQLSSRVTFHEHLLPVCLPPANKELVPGTVCTVIGWGKKEDTGMSEYEPEVNEVEVPVLNRDLCNSWLENRDLNVTDGMICAGYKEGGKDACQGDSGGPLLCRDDKDQDRWFVGGIVSWGIKCAHPHLPGVYAYVPKYIPWILKQMRLYSD